MYVIHLGVVYWQNDSGEISLWTMTMAPRPSVSLLIDHTAAWTEGDPQLGSQRLAIVLGGRSWVKTTAGGKGSCSCACCRGADVEARVLSFRF